MTQADWRFLGASVAAALALCVLLSLPAALRVTGHEGDVLHILDLAYRVAEGLTPHVDYPTPIGILAYAPLSVWLEAGVSPGRAVLLGLSSGLILSLPFVLWAALTRLSGAGRIVFVGFCLVMMGALVHGGDEPTVSISMYYNRWGWTLAFALWLMLFLPARAGLRSDLGDGLVLGLGFGVLVLMKVSFAAGLALPALVHIAQERPWAKLRVAVLSGAGVALLATLWGGLALWSAYIADLLLVSGSAERSYPSAPLADVLAQPRYLPGTALLLFAIIYWRRAGWAKQGALLMASAPGFVFITYQNWGNDPKWLALLAVLLLAFAHAHRDLPGRATTGTAAALAALTLVAPSALNMAYSPLRHLALTPAQYAPLLPEPARADIQVEAAHNAELVTLGRVRLGDVPPKQGEEAAQPSINGEVLPNCQALSGFTATLDHAFNTVKALGRPEPPFVVVADLLGDLWLTSDLPLNTASAPWYYSGTHGFAQADLVVVPLCPFSLKAREGRIAGLKSLDRPLREVARTPHVIVYALADP